LFSDHPLISRFFPVSSVSVVGVAFPMVGDDA